MEIEKGRMFSLLILLKLYSNISGVLWIPIQHPFKKILQVPGMSFGYISKNDCIPNSSKYSFKGFGSVSIVTTAIKAKFLINPTD